MAKTQLTVSLTDEDERTIASWVIVTDNPVDLKNQVALAITQDHAYLQGVLDEYGEGE